MGLKGLIRPYEALKGLIRPLRAFKGPYKALIRHLKALKGLIRSSSEALQGSTRGLKSISKASKVR